MSGSISLRKDGRWMGRFYENGIQRCCYAHTKAECKEKLKELIKQKEERADNRVARHYENVTLNDFSKDFLEIFKKPTVKYSTYYGYQNILKRFSKITLFKKRMCDVTHYDLNEFFTNCDVKYASYMLLKEMFDKAREIGFVKYSPMAMVVKPKKDTIETRTSTIVEDDSPLVTDDDFKKLGDYSTRLLSRGKYWVFCNLLYWTGLRAGEALALNKSDINFTENYILVCKNMMTANRQIDTTKSRKGTRKVPIFKPLVTMLKNYINDCKKEQLFEFGYHAIKKYLLDFYKSTGVKIKTHSFRKTFISKCQFEFGISPQVVAQWVGHESIDTTNEYYTFLTEGANERSIKLIDTVLDSQQLNDKKINY